MAELNYEEGDIYRERDLYCDEGTEEAMDSDAIDSEEDGFMQGYNE
ncbi:hypothetical protein J4438_00925 [Candidatus Woesearchaeota archaeon]|nr:hypothetical protein [Candidatus Woesearchaeota archaeon]